MIRFLWLLMIGTSVISGISDQEVFLQANSAYEHKNYQEALNRYEKIEPKTAPVWYNMGNCAYRLGQYLNALLYWRRAYALGSGSLVYQCAENMKLACQKQGIKSLCCKPFFKAHSLMIMQILFFCVFGVFLLLSRRLLQKKQYVLLMFMASALIGSGILICFGYHERVPVAFVMQSGVAVRAGPDVHYQELALLTAGNPVYVKQKRSNWCKIDGDGICGWVDEKNIAGIY